MLSTLAVGECFFKAATVLLGCLTTQMWWQCHMFLPLTLHGLPQFLYVLILGCFFFVRSGFSSSLLGRGCWGGLSSSPALCC